MSDPICGNCGNPLSQHEHGDQVYCYRTTLGTFTSEPSRDTLLAWIENELPLFEKHVRRRWKIAHGHDPD